MTKDQLQRLRLERAMLSNKLFNLKGFIGSDVWSEKLDDEDRELLLAQNTHMKAYLMVLDRRLNKAEADAG